MKGRIEAVGRCKKSNKNLIKKRIKKPKKSRW